MEEQLAREIIPLTTAQRAHLKRLAEAATAGPAEARVVPTGLPLDKVPFGVVSLTAGYETMRCWQSADACYYAFVDPNLALGTLAYVEQLEAQLAAAEARATQAAAEAGKWQAEAKAHAARCAVLEKANAAPYCEGQCGICDCETAPVAPQQQEDRPWERWFPVANARPSSDLTVIVRTAPGQPKLAAYYRKETDTWYATSGRKMGADEITEWRYQAGK